ncbi:MAG: CoA transferase [Steroidobacteraceae bacterium]
MQSLDPGFGMGGSATGGVRASELPRARQESPEMYPIVPCADGFVRICVLAPRQWQGMFNWMGKPEEFADPKYNNLFARFASPTLRPAIARLFADKTRTVLEEEGQRHGVPTAALLSLEEAVASEHFRERGVFSQVPIAPGVDVTLPNGVYVIDGVRTTARATLPAAEPADARFASSAQSSTLTENTGGRPLAGLRVLDFGVIVVGAEQGRLLADYGAEVIKVENTAFPDGARQTMERGAKISAGFVSGNRNKKSLGLNLRSERGRELLLQLARQSDIVLSNFKPGTLESLGLGNDVLLAANPRLILVDSSAFGSTGPWSTRMGYGPLVRASVGLSSLWRYADDPSAFHDRTTIYPDHVAARVGVAGILALLARRLRTGRGGTLSVAQAEVVLDHLAPQIAAAELARSGIAIEGSAQPAPWGVFPCAGEDEWCAVTVRDDADWQRLCRAIERPDLAADASLATTPQRVTQRARVDAALTDWLRERTPVEAMETLQSAGIPAGAMLRSWELLDFAPCRERRTFSTMQQNHMPEPLHVESRSVLAEHFADPVFNSAPLLGEHTREIARDLLGLSAADTEQLIAAGVFEVPA